MIFQVARTEVVPGYRDLELSRVEVAGGYVPCCFAIRQKKIPESSEGLESPLALHRVEGQQVLRGGGGRYDFTGKVSNCWSSKMGRFCLDCGSCQSMVTSCQVKSP